MEVTNPRHSWANNEDFAKAIDKLELFIVQDLYGDTDSSEHAHVFFPVAPGPAKNGVLINTERCLARLSPIIPSHMAGLQALKSSLKWEKLWAWAIH